MNRTSNPTESRIAAGIKTAAVVVLLGLIAIVAQPHRMHDETSVTPAATPVSAPVAQVIGPAGEVDSFGSHYPAPTNVEEQPPTF